MDRNSVIIVTGAAGFIGSYMVGYLNKKGYGNLILVDEFNVEEKEFNLHEKKYLVRVERDNLFEWFDIEKLTVDFVFHLGARTDTTEFDYSIHKKLNVEYSKNIWNWCARNKIPLVYASSAATYGSGELGYKDDHDVVERLQPLNAYGISKNEFDKWALQQTRNPKSETRNSPPFWAGLKFFNVYGPNEYHKGRMASVVFHAFNQIQSTDKVKLFKSHKPGFKDGEQLRDFIYVKDVAAVCYWMMKKMGNRQLTISNKQSSIDNGLYNVGTGKTRTFNDLANAIFKSLSLTSNIEYIDTPEDIRDKYQYFTEADMTKLRKAGYTEEFCSLEEGVKDYVSNFLVEKKYY